MDDKGKSKLLINPPEIVNNIARELDDEDVAALHSVNQALYDRTKYAFAKRHLTHVHVFLHPTSFDKLQRLVNDPFYAQYIEHITISTYVLRERDDRRKGSSVEPFAQGESFLVESAIQAVMNALQKTTALKSLTLSDFSKGSTFWPSEDIELPAWGINDLNRLATFRRGSAVVTEYNNKDDMKVWPNRMRAFEACLIGMSLANLPSHVELRMVLEGNAPRPLSPNAQSLFRRALSSVAHISTNVDAYVDSRENIGWLEKINPTTLALDYEMFPWECPDFAPNLHLGSYDHLANLRIVNAKTDGKELNKFLGAHQSTLRQVELKNICLLWSDARDYPWRSVFLTLAEIPELHHLWLNTLSAFPIDHVDRKPDPRAAQDVGWKTKLHVTYALEVLCDYYDSQGAGGFWIDLDYVEETLMVKYGVTI
ncbi:hypothetical protein P171DRAFT_479780 [Karstenula rhodostoma CBS 690.94]|uniref:Uncharacterized protein n=1 Tax=Karstenula rhodostoma CBS 690.94 TaxID=1392251 RepID=A0A9P4PST3_9PLEO|nr:hypothetical protein P171DRAFT_479780 [Karstenula rhodostoma CBS 690.94]